MILRDAHHRNLHLRQPSLALKKLPRSPAAKVLLLSPSQLHTGTAQTVTIPSPRPLPLPPPQTCPPRPEAKKTLPDPHISPSLLPSARGSIRHTPPLCCSLPGSSVGPAPPPPPLPRRPLGTSSCPRGVCPAAPSLQHTVPLALPRPHRGHLPPRHSDTASGSVSPPSFTPGDSSLPACLSPLSHCSTNAIGTPMAHAIASLPLKSGTGPGSLPLSGLTYLLSPGHLHLPCLARSAPANLALC